MRLQGKRVLVSGGNRGIGLAMAESFAREGAFVCITGRDDEALRRALQHLGAFSPHTLASHCDITDEASVTRLAAMVKTEMGGLDYLINNAGYAGPLKPIAEIGLSEWHKVLETNLTGLMLMCRSLTPLVAENGMVVNNLSVAAKEAFKGMASYCAAKAGAQAFTNVLREELREKRIRVVGLLPGAVETGIWQQFWPDAPRENMLDAKTVAELILHVCLIPNGAAVDFIHIGPVTGTL